MPSSDYTAATGGALKLKGAGVDKKKRKKKPKTTEASSATESTSTKSKPVENDNEEEDGDRAMHKALADADKEDLNDEDKKTLAGIRGKTEAERRYEEMRRKRLDERLKREGVKTHKERVEELNRYLSRLSEHHDMPRIGPG